MKHPNIGQLIEGEESRDAIHVAIAPVTAAHTLIAGRHVSIDATGQASEHTGKPSIGIIDPFLKRSVEKGEKCWLFLYPGTITSLRHDWTHPAMPVFPAGSGARDPECASKRWLEDIAERCGVSYQRMMDCVDDDDYINMGDNEKYKNVIDGCMEEFAKHCSIVLGRDVGSPYPFSCSC